MHSPRLDNRHSLSRDCANPHVARMFYEAYAAPTRATFPIRTVERNDRRLARLHPGMDVADGARIQKIREDRIMPATYEAPAVVEEAQLTQVTGGSIPSDSQ